MHKTENFMRDAMPAIAISLVALVFGVWASYLPPKTGEMAVVFSPGTSETQAFSAVLQAGGSFVSGSRFENVIIVYAHDEAFQSRINAFGGLFTLAATGLCTPVASAA